MPDPTLDELIVQVADLTTATTDLTSEVVNQKARLTTAANTATSDAASASTSAGAAGASQVSALASQQLATSEADRAVQVTGLGTVEAALDLAITEKGLQSTTEVGFRARTDEIINSTTASGWHSTFDMLEFQQIVGWEDSFKLLANGVNINGVRHTFGDTMVVGLPSPNGLQNKDLVSTDFATLAAAVVAGGLGLTESYLKNPRVIVIPAHKLIVTNDFSDSHMNNPNNNVHSVAGVLNEYPLELLVARVPESADNNTAAQLMIDLGWLQDANDVGLFTKDGYEATWPIWYTQRNALPFDQFINVYGCDQFSDGFDWYNTAVPHGNLSELATNGAGNGTIGSGTSGRYDNEKSDGVYARDVNHSVGSVHGYTTGLEQTVNDATQGKFDGWKPDPTLNFTAGGNKTVTVGGAITWTSASGGTLRIPVSAADSGLGILTNEFASISNSLTHHILQGSNGNSYIIEHSKNGGGVVNWPSSDDTCYLYGTPDITAALNVLFPAAVVLSIAAISIDLYGPKWSEHHIPTALGAIPNLVATAASYGVDRIPGCELVNAVPDGTQKDFKINRHVLSSQTSKWNFSATNGATWSSGTNFETLAAAWVTNSNAFVNMAAGSDWVVFLNYSTPASPFVPAEFDTIVEKSRLVLSTNNRAQAAFVSHLTGFVTTGSESEQLTIQSEKNGLIDFTPTSIIPDSVFAFAIVTSGGFDWLAVWPDTIGTIDYDDLTKCKMTKLGYK